ncbi:MAG: Holliday junction ATP-dependent DNA helicase RuvB [Candidatus Levybacteria bacterium GW2011_GWB1_39_7]|nr:MAG: Holliday junction ATP-dependent DNA helicase RuvB [Candidatus Levybacteria bacterium GW2011_GWA1_39_11]KKR24409.1 MAG: Holliday junction ATP-dependent DNA helicase RuvB [Candidatus Levybacteria bacterium GW2011_GWB1_39_7]KKR48135.1 MAG: Holliday junction ATP-dependent DNA helicase RuvB [Candidatus Levybacteria bacterium GW2011_GWA2_40_16]OGH45495.1 MAG: Holliday junction DNA helicase RuvB [Candidatus Levybacteria bacterium RIFCSPLOWO2_02_FULL_39_26]OGH48327.1 MAG: Holliday junction DNA 
MADKPKTKSSIVTENTTPEEEVVFTSLRVSDWEDFVGQEPVKKSIQIGIRAAKKRKESLEHVLLYGPPGLGKTTLSHLIAREMGANIRVTSGPAIERAGDLASILTNLEPGDVLFIDEIHRLNKVVEETLYPAMEEYCLDIIIGKGPSARTVRLDLPKFTIVGATTRAGMLSGPLRDRFGVVHRMVFYNPKNLEQIIEKAARKLKVKIDKKSISEIAKRARGTPRVALRLLKRARDYTQVHGDGSITFETASRALDLIEVDPLGLDNLDRRYLKSIIEKHSGGPVGVETIAASLAEDVGTIEEIVEPYLLQIGFIKRTSRGRVTTPSAYKHLEIKHRNSPEQKSLL